MYINNLKQDIKDNIADIFLELVKQKEVLEKAFSVFSKICDVEKKDLRIKYNRNYEIDYVYYSTMKFLNYDIDVSKLYLHDTKNLKELACITVLSKILNDNANFYTMEGKEESDIDHKHYAYFSKYNLKIELHTSYKDEED